MTQTGSTTDDQRPDATSSVDTADRPTAVQFSSRRERRAAEAAAARGEVVQAAAVAEPAAVAQPTTAAAVEADAVVVTDPVLAPKPAVAAGAAVVRAAEPEPEAPVVVSSSFAKSPVATAARRAAASRTAAATSASRPTGGAKRKVLPVAVMTITAGLFGSMALPAFASTMPQPAPGSQAAVAQANLRSADSQSITVADTAALADTVRDGYTSTAPKVVAPKAVAQTATTTPSTAAAAPTDTAVAAARAQTAASYASYTGPTAAQYVAAPKYPSFSLAQVVSVAEQYIGTPYVYGGATPAGFDCSGYVMYVYAQFGISLAHSVPLQDAAGTTIPTSEAQPGDVVIFNTEAHEGFYMGNGMIMDAPKPGGKVSIRPIWTTDYHIVRFGIK